jgi:hypothetical protein
MNRWRVKTWGSSDIMAGVGLRMVTGAAAIQKLRHGAKNASSL